MKDSPNKNSQKSSTSAVHVIAIAYAILFGISQIVIISLCVAHFLTFFDWLFFSISGVVSLILLISLDDAIKRINVLENKLMEKGVVKESELNEDADLPADLEDEGIKFCKVCDYQLFPEYTECPNCGAKIENEGEEDNHENIESYDEEN